MKAKKNSSFVYTILERISNSWAVCVDLVYRHTIIALTIILCINVASMLWYVSRHQSNLIETMALENALLYSQALTEFRTLYTREVVERVRAQGIEVTHDYEMKPGAIPLPATLSMKLGKSIGQRSSGTETRLYSAFPFPWRRETGGLQDDFAKEAWRFFRQNLHKPFYRFEDFRGRHSLRYATADLMRPSCVNCHNNHPDTPKNDWKEGDVRGVLEIIQPIDTIAAKTRTGLRGMFTLMTLMSALGLSGLALVITKFRSNALELEHGGVELSKANEALQQEIKERKRAENELQMANAELERHVSERTAELEAVNKELEAFSYSVSHDLRAPLRAINGFSQALLEDCHEQLNKVGQEHIDRIRNASQRMEQLIQDTLNLAYITRNKMRQRQVNLSTMAEEVAEELKKTNPRRKVEFVIQPNMEVKGDAGLLRIFLDNLLGNAWKFSGKKPHAKIEFGVQQSNAKKTYFVRDNGAGFDIAYADKLFDPFQRQHTKQEFKGTGIGLATAQRIIHRHGGKIWAEAAPDKGATFYFTLN